MQRRIQEVMDSLGWRSKTEEVREELRFWVERPDDLNHQLIRKSPKVTKVQVLNSSDAGGYQVEATMFRKEMKIAGERCQVGFTFLPPMMIFFPSHV